MNDYSPDPLWSMAAMPGETYQGWANRHTKLTYDWLLGDDDRFQSTRELAWNCLATARVSAERRAGRAFRDGQRDRALAAAEFARRLDLTGLIQPGAAAPAFLAEIHFGELLDAFLES